MWKNSSWTLKNALKVTEYSKIAGDKIYSNKIGILSLREKNNYCNRKYIKNENYPHKM